MARHRIALIGAQDESEMHRVYTGDDWLDEGMAGFGLLAFNAVTMRHERNGVRFVNGTRSVFYPWSAILYWTIDGGDDDD